MLRLLKSPLGLAITAVTAVLVASPEARKTARKLAVKGTAAVLDLIDQAKESTQHLLEEARTEQALPSSFPRERNTEENQDLGYENMNEQK